MKYTSKSSALRGRRAVVVLGPTASGKSELAFQIARRFGGEVISADSRQVYRGLDIGSGKVPISYAPRRGASTKSRIPTRGGIPVYKGIPHHLLDVASPRRVFTAAHYQKLAEKVLRGILARGHLPVICGGTGFYIDALLSGTRFPEVKPDPKLRRALDKKSAEELFAELKKRDPRRARNIDRHNKRRLIRALEIITHTGVPVPTPPSLPSGVLIRANKHTRQSGEIRGSEVGGEWTGVLKLGIRLSPKELKRRIRARLRARLKQGPPSPATRGLRRASMIQEIERLRREGLSWKRLDDLGLEYRYVSRYLQGLITKPQMIETIERESWKYAKRQTTWWKRDKKIVWIESPRGAIATTQEFLGA